MSTEDKNKMPFTAGNNLTGIFKLYHEAMMQKWFIHLEKKSQRPLTHTPRQFIFLSLDKNFRGSQAPIKLTAIFLQKPRMPIMIID
jgi:hypothetical protein